MSQLPITFLSREEQQRRMGRMYLLLGKQVKSYQKHRRMGDNTSIPAELARELMASMEYTIELAGGHAVAEDAEMALELGQKLLSAKVEKGKAMLDLAAATAPGWQTECRWEALRCLRGYLMGYDPIHLAHREPEELFYPIPVPVPEGIGGIDVCLFYLNILWLENQIMAGFEDGVLERLWGRLPTDTLNQCEQVVLNGLGKAMLYGVCGDLVFCEAERQRLRALLSGRITDLPEMAAMALCRSMDLAESNAADYIHAAALQMLPRIEAAAKHDHLAAVFL